MSWGWNVMIWLDQGVNVIFLKGSPDETISARCHRNRDKVRWDRCRRVINLIFFLQEDHCEEAYIRELARAHMPSNYRR